MVFFSTPLVVSLSTNYKTIHSFEISLITTLLLFLAFLASNFKDFFYESGKVIHSATSLNKNIYSNFRYKAMQVITGSAHCIPEDTMSPYTAVKMSPAFIGIILLYTITRATNLGRERIYFGLQFW